MTVQPREGTANHSTQAKSSPLPIFVSEALLALVHLQIVCDSLQATTAELSHCNKVSLAPKAENIYSVALSEIC